MADATGETKEPLRVAFDRRLKLEFHGARITSDGGLLAYRELDDALGLTATAASSLTENRCGKNIRHRAIEIIHPSEPSSAGTSPRAAPRSFRALRLKCRSRCRTPRRVPAPTRSIG